MDTQLPASIERYLEAENEDGTDAIAHCFAADAVVRDEGRTIVGPEAIQAWKRQAKARYRYRIEPLSALRVEPDHYLVRVRAIGDFPGSPIELDYAIALAGERIASLEIR